MAESPSLKIQYEYQNPSNVAAEVPGSQNIREAKGDHFQNSTEDVRDLDGAEKEYQNGGYTVTRSSSSYSEVRSEVVHGTTITTTNTRLTSGEDRSDAVSIEGRDHVDERRPKTKIPRLKFRQAAERVRSERRKTKEKSVIESQIPAPRSSIPKLTRASKIPPPTVKPTVTKREVREITTELTTVPDDEFEKIYEEIVESEQSDVIDDNIVINNVDDTEKIESKFEEIIHDYEENKIQPINVERLRQSRIPALKRKNVEVDASKSIKITSEINKVRSIPRLKEISMRVKADNDGVNQVITRKYTKIVTTEKILTEDTKKYEDANDEKNKSNITQTSTGIDTSKMEKYTKAITTEKTTKSKEIENKLPRGNETKMMTFHRSISASNNKGFSRDMESKIGSMHRSISLSSPDQSKSSTYIDDELESITKVTSQNENIVKESIKIGIPIFDSQVSNTEEIANAENIQSVQITKSIKLPINTEDYNNDKNDNSKQSNDKYEIYQRKVYEINDENPIVRGSITMAHISTDFSSHNNNVKVKEIEDIKSAVIDKESNYEQTPILKGKFDRYISKDVSEINKKEIYTIENRKIIEKDNIIETPVKEKDNNTVEDIAAWKGKVGRLINRIDTHEIISTDVPKKNLSEELPKKKSILSKIAMFERQDTVDEPMPSRKARAEKLPKLIIKDLAQETRVHVHTPKIVEEVLKPIQRDLDFSLLESKVEIDTKDVGLTTNNLLNVDSEMTTELKEVPDNYERIDDNIDWPIKEKDSSIQEEIAALRGKVGRLVHKIDSNEFHKVEIASNISEIKQSKINNRVLSPVQSKFDFNIVKNKDEVQNNVITDAPVILVTPKIDVSITAQSNFSFTSNLDKKFDISHKSVVEESNIIDDNRTPLQKNLDSKIMNLRDEISQIKNTTAVVEHQVTLPENLEEHAVIYEKIDALFDNAVKNEQQQLVYEEIRRDAAIISESTIGTINYESRLNENVVQYENIRPINEVMSTSLTNSVFEANVEDVFSSGSETSKKDSKYKFRSRTEENDVRRVKSLAELDLGDAVKGKVNNMIFRMKSVGIVDVGKKETISLKEMPRQLSVSEKIALFERKITPVPMDNALANGRSKASIQTKHTKSISEEEYQERIAELASARVKYGRVAAMPTFTLRNDAEMPVIAVGTALLDSRLLPHIIGTAIDLGYRAVDTAFIYGNERAVGEAIRTKIADGTVKREELFIISKLWSTFHRPDLVETACRASLAALGLTYFDLYLIHNPMSFKEGGDAIPKIATVIQYSQYDFMDAWYGMEQLVAKGLVKSIGVSNFNSMQIQRIMDKGKIKPVINQVECHPYLSQQRLDNFCSERNITLSCFGVLGSKGTPLEHKSPLPPVIDDPLVQVMASGLNVSAAQLLIRYQLECGHNVVVKSSSGSRMWDNLQALTFSLSPGQVDALHALNRNKRMFTFKGMGDTHKNYPFMVAF